MSIHTKDWNQNTTKELLIQVKGIFSNINVLYLVSPSWRKKRPFQCPIQWAHICAVKQTNNTTGATIDTWTHHIDWYRWFSALGHDTPNRRMMQDRIVVKTQFWAGLRQACSQGSTSSGQWGIDIRYHRCADLCFLLFLISKLPFYRIGS